MCVSGSGARTGLEPLDSLRESSSECDPHILPLPTSDARATWCPCFVTLWNSKRVSGVLGSPLHETARTHYGGAEAKGPAELCGVEVMLEKYRVVL